MFVRDATADARGDALYYAMNLDHFARVDHFSQWFTALCGTNFCRVATWVVHRWEIGFPLLLLSLSLRWSLGERDKAWFKRARARHSWWVGLAALAVAMLAAKPAAVLLFLLAASRWHARWRAVGHGGKTRRGRKEETRGKNERRAIKKES